MTTIREFQADDLFKFNHVNLDPLTETYHIPFYMQYMGYDKFLSMDLNSRDRNLSYPILYAIYGTMAFIMCNV